MEHQAGIAWADSRSSPSPVIEFRRVPEFFTTVGEKSGSNPVRSLSIGDSFEGGTRVVLFLVHTEGDVSERQLKVCRNKNSFLASNNSIIRFESLSIRSGLVALPLDTGCLRWQSNSKSGGGGSIWAGERLHRRLITPLLYAHEDSYSKAFPFDKMVEGILNPQMMEDWVRLMWEAISQGSHDHHH